MTRRKRMLLITVLGAAVLGAAWLYSAPSRETHRLSRMSTQSLSAWTRERPADVPARRLLGDRLLQEGRTEEALNLFREAAQTYPDAVWPLVAQSRALLQAGRLEEALALAQEVQRRAPEDADANAVLGEAHHSAGNREVAEEAFRTAARHDAENAAAHAGLALVLADKQDFTEARAAAQRAAELAPDTGPAYRALGYVEDKAANLTEAVRYLSLAAEREPHRGPTWAALSQVLVRAARTPAEYKAASDALDRTEALLPHMGGVVYFRGLLLAKQHKHEEAIAQFRQALERSPNATHALYNLATSLAFAGKKAESAAVSARFQRARQYELKMTQLRLRVAREPERADLWRRLQAVAEAQKDETTARIARERLQALASGQ